MSGIQITKDILINDSVSQYPYRFTLAGAPSTPLLADTLWIDGYIGNGSSGFALNSLSKVYASRSIPEQISTFSLDSTNNSQLNVISTAPAGTFAELFFNIKSEKWDMEFATNLRTFSSPYNIYLVIGPGETNATLLAKVYNYMTQNDSGLQGLNPLDGRKVIPVIPATATVSGNYSDGTVFTGILQSAVTTSPYVVNYTSISLLTVTARDSSMYFTNFQALDTTGAPSSVVTAFNPLITQKNFSGKGTYQKMLTKRLFTDDSVAPFQPWNALERVQPGAVYSEISFHRNINSYFVGGGQISNQNYGRDQHYVMYINESSCQTMLSDLATYLNRVAGTLFFSQSSTGVANPTTLANFIANI
jgi:hypothetical protein